MINYEPPMIISRLNMASIVLHRIDNRSGFTENEKYHNLSLKCDTPTTAHKKNNFLTCSC